MSMITGKVLIRFNFFLKKDATGGVSPHPDFIPHLPE